MGVEDTDAALVDEAMKKSGLIWLQSQPILGRPISQAVWHAWVDGKAYVLTGTGEQPHPGLRAGDTTQVVVRSKDNMQRLIVFDARVSVLSSDEDDWGPATEALTKGRLNLHDAQHAADRWKDADDIVILRLTPTGELVQGPGNYPDNSHRAAPLGSPASTRGPMPKVLHKRGHSGRSLS